MSGAETADLADIDQLVALQCGLFREDAAVHDRFVDLRWPVDESAADLRQRLRAGGRRLLHR